MCMLIGRLRGAGGNRCGAGSCDRGTLVDMYKAEMVFAKRESICRVIPFLIAAKSPVTFPHEKVDILNLYL